MGEFKVLLRIISKQIERFEDNDMPGLVRCEVAYLKSVAKDMDKRMETLIPSWAKAFPTPRTWEMKC